MSTPVKAGRIVRDLPDAAPALHRCRLCSRAFGRYHVRQLSDSWQLVDGNRWFRPESRPRTGTGLSAEIYDGVGYVRIRCKCRPRNEKLRLENYLKLPVEEDSKGPIVYL
jgi:hypothetical protein